MLGGCPNSKALSFTFKCALNLFSIVFNPFPVVVMFKKISRDHIYATSIRRWYDVFWMPYSCCVSSTYICVHSLLQCESSTHLIIDCWTGFLSFKLSVSGCSKIGYQFAVLLRKHNIIAETAAKLERSQIWKNLINFRNRKTLVADRLQSINLVLRINTQYNL